MHIDIELDTCGLNCPLPILKTKKALSGMQAGQHIRVRSTDSGAARDFEAFARQTGHTLVEQSSQGNEFIFVLQRR